MCGFVNYTVEPEENLRIEDWGLLCAEESAFDFIPATDNLATCRLRTVEEIIYKVTAPQGESSSRDDDGEVTNDEQPPTTAETLHALDVLRRIVRWVALRWSNDVLTNSNFLSKDTYANGRPPRSCVYGWARWANNFAMSRHRLGPIVSSINASEDTCARFNMFQKCLLGDVKKKKRLVFLHV
ncbi:uncharacterized protein LOC120844656 [Ixodes scapularis]|uniref:uncharacterized protein LOC120844656 n=1 Tax=Ixodes scapularis TaxID=6945 RepID=UPI001A9D0393|nr:uncharacterized protein LOC120844656 [Ixodes scapularis]